MVGDRLEIYLRKNMKKELQRDIEKLSNKVLENSGVYREYSNADLANALLIFTEVFMAKMHDRSDELKFTQEQRLELATLAGTKLRETVELFTGVDMHDVFKK